MNRRIFALLPVVTFACAANSAPSSRANGSGGNTGDGVGGSGIITNTGGSGPVIPGCSKDCTDFQTAVIFDGAATADVATKFGDPSTGGPAAACIIEPAPGSMVPRNWWRPRVHFTAQPGEALFEIRVHADIEKNDLVDLPQLAHRLAGRGLLEPVVALVADGMVEVVFVRQHLGYQA